MSKWNEGGGEPPKIETRTPEAPRAAPKEKPTEPPVTDASQPKTPKEIVSAPNAEKVASRVEPERPPAPASDLLRGGANTAKTAANADVRSEPKEPPPPSAELRSSGTDTVKKPSSQNEGASGKLLAGARAGLEMLVVVQQQDIPKTLPQDVPVYTMPAQKQNEEQGRIREMIKSAAEASRAAVEEQEKREKERKDGKR